MFIYNVGLGLSSLRKSPILTALVVGLIALGVGMSMITLTIYSAMSGDPVPSKSDRLFAVSIDSWDGDQPARDDKPDSAPFQLTYIDAMALRQLPGTKRRAAMFKGVYTLIPESEELKPFFAGSRMTDGDFFEMFDVPFRYGGPWSKEVDQTAERVVVLSDRINQKYFGGRNSVGESVRLGTEDFEIVGVLKEWTPIPTYYDLNNGYFDDTQDLFMPFSMLQFWGASIVRGNTKLLG